ncbi:CGNR zinc finger domain-containing protein [Actinopolymorpha pittospori]
MISWPATLRYALTAAPSGLALVQELLNTNAAGNDLLDDVPGALEWVETVLDSYAHTTHRDRLEVTVDATDVEALRALRTDIFSVINEGAGGQGPDVPKSVTLGFSIADGNVDLHPRGDGWRAITAAVYFECFIAQQDGTWRRLKTCRNPRCAAAFYDQSRNNSGVWHDVKVCGNAANLRKSRERRRLA